MRAGASMRKYVPVAGRMAGRRDAG
ncbi:MAG: hypothetical protein QOI69_1525, partial [Pseudonocardiales bacterium]|nr:hypothetical protein [Pseudonocardiales bacterium]